MKNKNAPKESGAHSYKKESRTARASGPRDKAKGKTRQPGPSGARVVSGKDVVADKVSRPGIHNGRPIPEPTRAVDLTDEVSDLSPRGAKK